MPLIRYTLLQIPGWLLLGTLLWWAVSRGWIGLLTGVGIMAVWVIKDAILYPICKRAFEDSHPVETAKLIGLEAETVNTLAPKGLVRVRGELWSAHVLNDASIASGSRIRITGAEGLILIVEPAA